MFKTSESMIGKFEENRSFSLFRPKMFGWLKSLKSHKCNMGEELGDSIVDQLAVLIVECERVGIELPPSFIKFFKTPIFWTKFRSTNSGFFDLREMPVKCPVSSGYLIPFITDQQCTHYHYLHLVPGEDKYQVVWTDDLYNEAIYATEEEFIEDYSDEFDEEDIYLLDDDFEHFLKCHHRIHEGWLKKNGF